MNMLTPFPAQKWNDQSAAHLLNRAAFGGTPAEIEATRRRGLTASVNQLLDIPSHAAAVPPPSWAQPSNRRQMKVQKRAEEADPERRKEKMRQQQVTEGEHLLDLRRWWLDRMMNGPAPLLEKMTLFWHGHFATGAQKVKDPYWMWLQNDTLRRNALGNFTELVKKISRDPAMMIYLDLQQSRREHPNENWARELMELFTIGIGNYTEQDVREAARAFTGYRIDMTVQQFRFAELQQDRGDKTFLGRNGSLDGDDVIEILVKHPACANFIGRKLWRYFVEDDPAPAIVDLVAERLRAHRLEMRPVLREIFTSEEFYSDRVRRSQIKSPIQFIVQTAKLLETDLPSPVIVQNAMRQMGQILFAPPNVKGWEGGKSWISTSTLLFRYNFANYMINGDAMLPPQRPAVTRTVQTVGPGLQHTIRIQPEPAPRAPINIARLAPQNLRDRPNEIVDLLSTRLFQDRPPETAAKTFVEFLQARGMDASDATMRGLVHLMTSTPQFQIT